MKRLMYIVSVISAIWLSTSIFAVNPNLGLDLVIEKLCSLTDTMDTELMDKVCDIQLTLTCQKDVTPIFQSDVDAGGGNYLISAPGNYCVVENLTGLAAVPLIVIAASDVVLDLNQKTLTGAADGNGIVISSGNSNIIVKDGLIKDVPSAVGDLNGNGILVQNSVTCLSVHNIVIKNCRKGVNCVGAGGMEIDNLRFDTVDVSQATVDGFSLTQVHSGVFNHCSASFNTLAGAAFAMSTSTNIVVKELLATNNSAAGALGQGMSIDECSSVYLIDCRVDSNSFTSTHYQAFFIANSSAINAHRCYVTNNFDVNNMLVPTSFSAFLLNNCRAINMQDCHADANTTFNRCTMYIFDVQNSHECIFKQCTANDNLLDQGPIVAVPRETRGFSLINSYDCRVVECCVHNSRSAFNNTSDVTYGFISLGGSTRNEYSHCSTVMIDQAHVWQGFYLASYDIADSCYAQNFDISLLGVAFFIPGGSVRTCITHCTALNTSAVPLHTGFLVGAATTDIYLRYNLAQGYNRGFDVTGTTHSVYDNYACHNTINYSIPGIYPISHPTTATPLDNIDCAAVPVDAIFDKICTTDSKIDVLDSKVDVIDGEVAVIDSKIDVIDGEVAVIDSKIDVIDGEVAVLDSKVDVIDGDVGSIFDKVCDIQLTLTCIKDVTPIYQSDIVANNGQVVLVSGNYCLAEDLQATVAVPMLLVAGDNVVIDLNGKVVSGSGVPFASGVVANGALKNIVIKNGTIEDMISSSTVGAIQGSGINMNVSDTCIQVEDVVIKNCQNGLYFFGGGLMNCVVKNSQCNDCIQTGMNFTVVDNLVIKCCSANDNGEHGILLNLSNNAVIVDTTCFKNTMNGIVLDTVTDVTIRQCDASANDRGIYLPTTGSQNFNVVVQECNLSSNTTTGGEEISASPRNIWLSNFASGNGTNFTIPGHNLIVSSIVATTSSYANIAL